jgi:hypothetical protein
VASYTVSGTAAGTFKTVGNLSWLRVFGAGHEVPYYRTYFQLVWKVEEVAMLTYHIEPAVALQVFKQTMQKKAISST